MWPLLTFRGEKEQSFNLFLFQRLFKAREEEAKGDIMPSHPSGSQNATCLLLLKQHFAFSKGVQIKNDFVGELLI